MLKECLFPWTRGGGVPGEGRIGCGLTCIAPSFTTPYFKNFMRFKTIREASAYADTLNKLENDVDAVFFRFERKLRNAGGGRVICELHRRVCSLEKECGELISKRLGAFLSEWDV